MCVVEGCDKNDPSKRNKSSHWYCGGGGGGAYSQFVVLFLMLDHVFMIKSNMGLIICVCKCTVHLCLFAQVIYVYVKPM
jgi:hypothetical protein